MGMMAILQHPAVREAAPVCQKINQKNINSYCNGKYQSVTQYRKFETIIPKKEFRGLSPNFHIHVSVSDFYIPTIGLPILLQENMWTDPGNVYKSLTYSTHECGNWD
jgi:hypothetical protein